MPKHHISRRIRFGLFPFRSPLLGKSLLISPPRGTKMLQFPRFDLHRPCDGVPKGQDSHSDISGSQDACAFPELIAACHVLRLSSSPAIHLLASLHRHVQPHITRLCTTIIAGVLGGRPLHPSYGTFVPHCIDAVKTCATAQFWSKEVIRPQVPLRSPCYDFSLVAYLKFDNAN